MLKQGCIPSINAWVLPLKEFLINSKVFASSTIFSFSMRLGFSLALSAWLMLRNGATGIWGGRKKPSFEEKTRFLFAFCTFFRTYAVEHSTSCSSAIYRRRTLFPTPDKSGNYNLKCVTPISFDMNLSAFANL